MFGAFKRPVGAAADVRELEYVSALHQTSSVLDTEGTISAQDVLLFLRSRFGLELTQEDAMDIVKGLSGTARLPLPSIEKKVWKLRRLRNKVRQKAPRDDGDLAESLIPMEKICSCLRRKSRDVEEDELAVLPGLVSSVQAKKKCSCLRRKTEGEDEEDELAAVEAQLTSLQGKDAKRGWEFPALQRQIRREVPKDVATLVRFDLVQMTAMLLIPSLLRIDRHRFKAPRTTPVLQPSPPFWKTHKLPHRIWVLSGLAVKILRFPLMLIHRQRHRHLSAIKQSLRPKPDTILLDVLRILLGSLEDREEPVSSLNSFVVDDSMTFTTGVSGRMYFPELLRTVVTQDLIRDMLRRHQLEDAGQDEVLIKQMVELVGGEGAILDERAFAHALTSDVKSWPLECEDDVTTTFYDVYGFSNVECNKFADILKPEDLLQAPSRDADWSPELVAQQLPEDLSELSFHSAETELQENDEETGKSDVSVTGPEQRPRRMGKVPKFKRVASCIDYASDAFRSARFVVFLFAFYLVASAFILNILNASGVTSLTCESSFGCILVQTIYSWLIIAVVLSLGGIIIIVPISLVNDPYLKSSSYAYCSIALLVFYMAIPVVEVFLVDYVGITVSDEYLLARSQDANIALFSSFLVSGFLTLIEAFRGLASLWLPKPLVRRFAILRLLFVPVDIRRTAVQKVAGTYKINSLLHHAYRLQRKAHKKTNARNAEHEAMMCFLFYGEKDENCGGFFWTWARTLWKHTEGREEGLWMHSRLFVGQMGQFLIIVVFSVGWLYSTKALATDADEKRQSIIDDGGLGSKTALYYVPESWMIYWSFIPGGSITLLMLLILLMIPYPNTQSMILKYRSGIYQSLHSRTFQKYRENAALIYYNTGNMIYASIGAGGIFFILFVGALFFLFWPPTGNIIRLIIAWGIGLGITIGLKMVLTHFIGKSYWKSMYRRQPAAANLSSVGYECWHIGLGGGVMIGRLCQFLFAAAFWIGRIDSQFLHEDVQAFGYRFDLVPEKYTSEVLIHEAHRHPFMERLAAMYLMRLKHGEYFGSDAGAAWRKLFVLALMPWLMKYSKERRIDFDENDDDNDEEFAPLGDSLPPIPDDETMKIRVSGNVPWIKSSGSEYFSPEEDEVYEDESGEFAPDGVGTESQLSRRVSWKRPASARSEYFSPEED